MSSDVFLLKSSMFLTSNVIIACIDVITFFCKPLSPFFQWTTSRCPATESSTAYTFLEPTRASMWRGTVCVGILLHCSSVFSLILLCSPHAWCTPTILCQILPHFTITPSLFTAFYSDPSSLPHRQRPALGKCLAAFSAAFPVAFLERQINRFNSFSIYNIRGAKDRAGAGPCVYWLTLGSSKC